MGKIENHKKIIYGGKSYGVFNVTYKNKKIPAILNWKDFLTIKKLDKLWYINENGMVVCFHNHGGIDVELGMHEIVMAQKQQNTEKKPIIHINRLGIDNRRDNLIYDVVNKDINKNLRKKKRTIALPKESGINPSDLPTYVWYLKANDSHGERFIVEIGNKSWKTSSSKTLSLKYKLEEAKKYLRELKESKPELFENYSMNGDFNKDGKKMLDSYYAIVEEAGYKLNKVLTGGSTDKYLEEDLTGLDEEEINLLHSSNLS